MSLSNRAHTFLATARAEDALRDANQATLRRPHWAKGHFRRARALGALGLEDEALVALFVCAALESSKEDLGAVLGELTKALKAAAGGGGRVLRERVARTPPLEGRKRRQAPPEEAPGALVGKVLQKFVLELKQIKCK